MTTVYTSTEVVRAIETKHVPVSPDEPGVTTPVYRTTLTNGISVNLDTILHIGQTVTMTLVAEDPA